MSLITRTHKVTRPNELANELIDARAAYNEVRLSVIDRAVERQKVIEEAIADLKGEQSVLASIEDDARRE